MRLLLFFIAMLMPAAVAAQAYDPAPRIAAQRAAMARLSAMDGVWRGPAWSITPTGRQDMIQTERIGTFLDGTVRMLEGRGYHADGRVGFNALGIISYDPARQVYSLATWAMGQHIIVPLTITDTGYVWETPAGPGAVIRYTATIGDGRWVEIGERIAGSAPPVRMVEMRLTRVGDTAWPASEPVPMR